jgi:hypothetical protein
MVEFIEENFKVESSRGLKSILFLFYYHFSKVAIHSPTFFTSCANNGQIKSVAASFCAFVKPAVVSLSIVT